MRLLQVVVGLLALLTWGAQAHDAATPHQHPVIALIIDDLGNQRAEGERSVHLPGAVTYAILPQTPHGAWLAELAHRNAKEVMLHLPMQAVHDHPLGPGGVTLDMSEARFKQTLRENLASIPHVQGVNNHMGSLLTRHPGHMEWLMQVLAEETPMYFVDSRTTAETVAMRVALERRVPTVDRDVFLDTERGDPEYVAQQFEQLLEVARRRGVAVGIGHPYPDTLAVLEDKLADLMQSSEIELVPISKLLQIKEGRQAWQASLSPSPTAVKN